jgi:phage gp45-like
MSHSSIERLYHRVLAVIGRGKIQLVNDTGPIQTMQIVLNLRETLDGCPRLAEYGFSSFPQDGASAVLAFMGGDRNNGVVIATGDTRYRVTLQKGECVIHDDQQQVVHIAHGGIVVDTGPTGNPITLNTSGSVNINASGSVNVNATGNAVIATGGTVQLGAAGGKKIALDGDPVVGGKVQASSTKATGT